MSKMGELSVLIRGNNQLTPELNTVNASLKSFSSTHKSTTDITEYNTKLSNRSFSQMKSAVRELANGVGFLGSTFIGLGSSMEKSTNKTTQNIGQMVLMAGTIMTAVASSVQFVSAISKMVSALNKLRSAQILAQAFSGPGGWGMLAVGGLVAGGTIATVSAISKASSEKTTSTAGNSVTVNVAGSVVTEKKLTEVVRQGIVTGQSRNYTSGIK